MKKRDLYSHIKKLPYIDTSMTFFSAHQQHVAYNWTAYPSSHTAFEVLLLLEGKQESVLNKTTYIMNKGDILLIPPGMIHYSKCISYEGMTYFVAHFDIDDPALRYTMMKNGKRSYQKGTPHNDSIRGVLEDWITLYKKEDSYTLSDRLASMEILTRLMLTFVQISEEEINNHSDIQSLSLARSIADAIHHNFNSFLLDEERNKEKILLKNIYQEANVSMSYGLEIFRKVYGTTPKEYLDQLKFREAKRLIRNPDISIEMISDQLGYSNVSHFSRQFKKWSGVSPRNYCKNSWK